MLQVGGGSVVIRSSLLLAPPATKERPSLSVWNVEKNLPQGLSSTITPGHTGERNYECVECVKYLHGKNHLTRQIQTHTGERNYVCEECRKTFTEKSSLTRHIQTHTGERNYECWESGNTLIG